MKKSFVKIEIEEKEDSMSFNIQTKGNNILIIAGLIEALIDCFVKSVNVPVQDGTQQLLDLIQRKIQEKTGQEIM